MALEAFVDAASPFEERIKGYFLESIIFKDPQNTQIYASEVLACRHAKAEEALLKSKNLRYIYIYAVTIIGDRWPEAEAIIGKCPNRSKQYIDKFCCIEDPNSNLPNEMLESYVKALNGETECDC